MSESELQKIMAQVRQEYEPTQDDQRRIYQAVMAAPLVMPADPSMSTGGIPALTLVKGFGATVLTLLLASGVYYGYTRYTVSDAPTAATLPAAAPQSSATTDTPELPPVSVPDTSERPLSGSNLALPPAATTTAKPAEAPAPIATPVSAKSSRQIMSAAPRTKAAGSKADDLAAELRLVSDAAGALNQGNSGEAMKSLREHKTRFPNGVMTQERNGLEIIALCQDGQMTRAEKKYAAFAARSPNAPILMRISNACGFK